MTKITTCCIKGCEKPVRTKAFCDEHYLQWWEYGHPIANKLNDYARIRRPKRKERGAWASMKYRCYNPKYKNFKEYGGRGIAVCTEWLKSFDQFFKDLGPAPTPYHSLERKDVNQGYNPDNCRWATLLEQNRNRRDTVLTKEKVIEAVFRNQTGETTADLAREFGVKYHTLYQAIKGVSWKEFQRAS